MSGLELPAVLLLKGERACILQTSTSMRNGRRWCCRKPASGKPNSTCPNLERRYTGFALFVRPKFRKDRQLASRSCSLREKLVLGTAVFSWRIYRDVLLASLLINIFGSGLVRSSP